MRQVRLQQICGLVMVVCFCLCLAGCGKKQKYPDGMPEPFPTVITITQEGQPLQGASIALIPMDSKNSWNAGGMTDASGKASLLTLTKYNGVVPGKYYVIITKRESDGSKYTQPDPETDPEGYAKFMRESMGEKIASYDLIDPKYGKISPTAETIDVAEGKNEKTIDVGKAVRQKH